MSLGVQGGTGDEGMTPARAKPAPSSTAAPSVSLRGLTKRFGDFAAVRDMDLDIPRGHFFTMLGPSGCGKTTTLRMIAGFEEPSEGTVLLDGDDVTGLPARRRRLARPAAVPAADQHGFPELRAVPAPERRAQRRVRPGAQARVEGRGEAQGWRRARARGPGPRGAA